MIGRDVCIDTIESFGLYMDSAGVLAVKGCRRVSVCEENRIVLHAPCGTVLITGERLRLMLFSPQETQIGGMIGSICFNNEVMNDAR